MAIKSCRPGHSAFAFLTGYDRETLPARFANERILCKPFQRDQLLSTLQSLARH